VKVAITCPLPSAECYREDGPIALRLRQAIDVLDVGGRHEMTVSFQFPGSFVRRL